jgi:hypothetical protein
MLKIIEEYSAGKRDFRGADLSGDNLSGADLSGADLIGADLRCANLIGANLSGADLSGADLRCAYLIGANLSGANLIGANLRGADLDDADLKKTMLPNFQIPGGVIQGWKKLSDGLICELTIPWEAKRTASLVGRKCRAEFAYISAIYNGTKTVSNGFSQHDNTMQYIVGTVVHPDKYDDDIRVECSHGIHFFLTRKEAEEY